jgi:hypothetical protein
MNPITIVETDIFQKEIRKVALLNARDLAENGILPSKDAEEFYITSGLKIIFRHLFNDGIIRDRIDSLFIEFSTLVSTLEQNILDAFTLVFEKGNPAESLFKENVQNNFKPIIKTLRDEYLAVFNHPEFIIKPHSIKTYISIFNQSEPFITESQFSEYYEGYGKSCFEKAKSLFSTITDKVEFNTKDHSVKLTGFKDIIKDALVYINSSAIRGEDISYEKITDPKLLDKYRTSAVLTNHLLNHLLYQKYFIPEDAKFNKTIFVSLPILASNAELEKEIKKGISGNINMIEMQPYNGLGALFLFMTLKKGNSDYNKMINETLPFVTENIQSFCKSISLPIKDFIHGYAFKINQRYRSQIEHHATKSAIAAVMSRNMSHNIGSHVLSKLSNLDSEKVETIQKNDYKTTADWIDQSKIFYSYLQRRMEFIADISTAETIVTNASFFQKDILNKFKTVGESDDYPHFIANFISGVTELNRDNIQVKGFLKKNTEIFDLDENKFHDTLIDLPNDALGAQALYVMLENIIRNASKHNKIENSLDLSLFIEDSNVAPDYYEISIVDNQHEIHKQKYNDDKERNNLPPIINNAIQKAILEKGKVRDSSWGILELKICAAYLAKQELEDIDNVNISGEPLIQSAYFDDSGNIDYEFTHFNFGYKFWLLKPKLVLIATDDIKEFTVIKDKNGVETNFERELNNKGVYFTDKSVIRKLVENGTEHQYLVIDSSDRIQISIPALGKDSSNQNIISINSIQKKKLIDILILSSRDHSAIREFLISCYYPDYKVKNITSKFEGVELEINKAASEARKIKNAPFLVIESNEGNIVFDNHGNAREDDNLPREFTFWEYCGTQSGTAEILSNAKQNIFFLNEITNAALKRVVVIDERIQENTTDKEKENLGKANIIIPHKDDVNLMSQSFDDAKVEIEIHNQLKLSPAYFIIHLGVIEKFLKATTKGEIMEWIDKKFKLKEKEEAKNLEERTKLIIISGRGKPPTLPRRSLYLPYSLVAQCILPANQSSKLKLIQLLNKARRHA